MPETQEEQKARQTRLQMRSPAEIERDRNRRATLLDAAALAQAVADGRPLNRSVAERLVQALLLLAAE